MGFKIENGVLKKYTEEPGVTEVVIPDGVTSIGRHAFEECSSLTSITIPDGVTSIGEYAFCVCYGLTSITIPDSVTSIGRSAFAGCEGMESITIPGSVASVGRDLCGCCISLKNVTVSEGVTSIGDEAFFGCSELTSITIPSSVTSIGSQAFFACPSLKNIKIPDSVTSIGGQAFCGCKALSDFNGFVIIRGVLCGYYGSNQKIVIPDSVTHIDDWACNYCDDLHRIAILPSSITSIGDMAFTSDKTGIMPCKFLGENGAVYAALVLAGNIAECSGNPIDWDAYDVRLASNKFKTMRADSRLLAILYRLRWPYELNEEIKELYMEYAAKNYRKAVPLAELMDDSELITALIMNDCVEEKNKKTFNKLLAASTNPNIAAMADN